MSKAPRHSFGPALEQPSRIESRKDLIDTWRWHSQFCEPCRTALQKAKRLRQLALAFGIFTIGISPITPSFRILGLLLASASFLVANTIISAVRGYHDASDVSDRSVAATADDDQKADARIHLRKKEAVA
mmetsp:Transcript_12617/g.18925  ORF Transcript_12617/g.18925 Transcript_12617/m.18925 type:complete len:130 (+) Transcript_12617:88-477(+)